MIKLDILSDPVCPWCYIGKARLDRALEQRPDHPFAIEWHPFQLNPEMPDGGMDRRTYLEKKFGGKDAAYEAYKPVLEHSQAAGLEIEFDEIKRTPNTLDAHRLIHWAGIEGRQTAAVSALFRAYFKEGRDIGDRSILAEIASGLELDPEAIGKLLESDADADLIRQRDAHSREMGVTAVPTFIVGNRHVVPGAQTAEFWLKVMDEIAEQDAS